MTPEHRQLIGALAQVGRLGTFCVWPNPPAFTAKPEANRIDTELRRGDEQLQALMTQGIRYANPGWLAELWEQIKKGPPNQGCTTPPPWCPKGWCTGQGDCPWSRRQLRNLRQQIKAETAREDGRWYLAACQDCEPILPQPFRTAADRDEWANAHRRTGHNVDTYEEG